MTTEEAVPNTGSPTRDRAYPAALVVLLLVQLLIGLYGIDQTPQFGHQGYHVAEHGLGARNLNRWGTLTHTTHHGPGKPPEASLNFHHLTMLQVPVWITQSAFGDQSAWPVRVVGLFFSLAAALGIWLFARKARGPAVAVVVAAAFVFNPLHVAFGNLPDIQMVSIAWLSWAGVALLALFERPTWLGVGLLWLCVATGALADWAFYPVIFWVVFFVALRVRPHPPLAETLDKTGIVRVRTAASFARDIGAKVAVIEHALAGETPVLDALPDEFALQRVPPSRLAFTRRVGGRGGNERTAQCWGPRAVSQIVAAHPPERPDRLAWVQPVCRDVAKKGEHLDVVAAPHVGPRFGLPDGHGITIRCPDSTVPVGVAVRADSLVNQISLLCAEMRLSSPIDPVKPRAGPSSRDVSTIPSMYLRGPLIEEGAVGGEVGDAHRLVCPADSLLFGLVGRTGALVDAIGLSCIAIEAVLSQP